MSPGGRGAWRRSVQARVAVIVAAGALAASCSTDPGPEPGPDSAPGQTAPAQEGPSAGGTSMESFLNPENAHNDTGQGTQAPGGAMALSAREEGAFGADRLSFFDAATSEPFARYLQVTYPAHSASRAAARSDNIPEGGAQSYWNLPAPVDEAYLRYWVWFPPGFDFVKGGKLPGLFGGTQTSGGEVPDGTDGFSTRYMWRRDGAGEVYAYLPSSAEHGTSLGRGSWTFPTGRWACMEQHVKLNDPGAADGAIAVWLDDQPVFSVGELTFRSTSALKIDGLFFSTFFGGGDSSWATPTDQVARFGGVQISPTRLGCS